jgi:hypothetical protein
MSEELPSILDLGIDIADAPAPEIIPAGDYTAEIRAASPKQSAAGNHYVAVQFYISPDEYPADFDQAEAPDGTILTFNRVPWPQSKDDKRGIYRLRKFMESIGAPFAGSKVDLDKWVGLKAIVSIKHGTYEGEVRPELTKVSKDI